MRGALRQRLGGQAPDRIQGLLVETGEGGLQFIIRSFPGETFGADRGSGVADGTTKRLAQVRRRIFEIIILTDGADVSTVGFCCWYGVG
jgi:hypothetical protein